MSRLDRWVERGLHALLILCCVIWVGSFVLMLIGLYGSRELVLSTAHVMQWLGMIK